MKDRALTWPMECGSTISLATIAQGAVRVGGTDAGCYAIAVTTGDAAGDPLCDGPPLLSLLGGAFDGGAILVSSASGPYTQEDCDEQVGVDASAMASILTGAANAVAILEPEDIDASCSASCDDEGIATSAMLQGSFVESGGRTRALAKAVTGFVALDCSTNDISMETIVRGAMIKVADGLWAWRIQYEDQGPRLVARATASGTGTTATFNIPTGNVGDLLVLQMGADAIPSAPAGWTEKVNQLFGSDMQQLAVFVRTADGSEGATVSVSLHMGNDWSGICSRYTGTTGAGAVTVTHDDTGGASPVAMSNTGVTTTVANSRVMVMTAEDHGVGATIGQFVHPTGYGHVVQEANTYGNTGVSDALVATAGATGTLNMSVTMATGSSAGWCMVAMEVKGTV